MVRSDRRDRGHDPAWVKPGTAGFEAIASGWDLSGQRLAYVADNPKKDFIGPRRLGWRTVRLQAPEQLRVDVEPTTADQRADHVVHTVAELMEFVHP